MNTVKFNNTVLEILINDIVESDLDAIVVPANSRLLPSGTLRCTVLRKAGSKVQLECNRIINKIGVVNVGTAVMTSGGNLSKHIIHVVGPNRQHQVGKKLMLSTWNSLNLADEAGLKITVLPEASEAKSPPQGMAMGKFQGGITSPTPLPLH